MLTEEDDHVDLSKIAGVLWDARVGAHRVAPFRCATVAAELRSRGVRVTDETASYVRWPDEAFSGLVLRNYQEAALKAWESARRG